MRQSALAFFSVLMLALLIDVALMQESSVTDAEIINKSVDVGEPFEPPSNHTLTLRVSTSRGWVVFDQLVTPSVYVDVQIGDHVPVYLERGRITQYVYRRTAKITLKRETQYVYQ